MADLPGDVTINPDQTNIDLKIGGLTFSVACAGDEFYYFPQVRLPQPQWSIWDCFSSEAITDFVWHLSAWKDELDRLSSHESELEVQIDIALLQRIACTPREQLSEVIH